jgi:hypothetical protein
MRDVLVLASFVAILIGVASRGQIRVDASPVVVAHRNPAVIQSATLPLLKSGECQGDGFWRGGRRIMRGNGGAMRRKTSGKRLADLWGGEIIKQQRPTLVVGNASSAFVISQQ